MSATGHSTQDPDQPVAREPRSERGSEVDRKQPLADAKLFGDEEPTDAVLDEVAIDLFAEMRARILEPIEDLQTALVGEGAKGGGDSHLGNWLIPLNMPS